MDNNRWFQISGIFLIMLAPIIFNLNIFQPFSISFATTSLLFGIALLVYSITEKQNQNVLQLTTLFIVILALSCSVYVITKVSEPLPPDVKIQKVGDIQIQAQKGDYSYNWRVTTPISLRIIVRNPSDITINNFNFSRDLSKDSIFVTSQAGETNVTAFIPESKRVLSTDSDVTINLPMEINAWIAPGHGMFNFGKITKEKIGEIKFNVTITDLDTGKTDTESVTKDVIWIYDATYS